MRWLFCLIGFAVHPAYAASWDFHGELSAVTSSSPECEFVFKDVTYSTRVFAVGANHLTAVVYFQSPSDVGALNKQSLLGNHGGLGDIRVEKSWVAGGKTLKVVGEGLFDQDVLVLDLSAKLTDAGGGTLCSATADYTGFPN